MLSCINKNSKEFRDLKEISGLSEKELEAECRWAMQHLRRFPHLDELLDANSEPYIKHKLSLDSYSTTSLDTLFEITGKETVDEALTVLNNTYRDLEIEGTVLNDGSIIIDIEHKPVSSRVDITPEIVQDNIHDALIIEEFSNKLSNLYGMKITPITIDEINKDTELSIIPNISIAKAFIFNNNIYINTDNATLDSKVHELMHILFGSMRYSTPELYYNLISTAQNFYNFELIAKIYSGRTQGDILEEVFITELSKYLVGKSSAINKLSEKEVHEIFYLTHRLLDIAFMGDYSVKSIPTDLLYSLSLKLIGKYVNSAITNLSFKGSVSDAEISRILANTKSELIREGSLKEYCE